MLSQSLRRSCGWCRTAGPCRRASVPRWCRLPRRRRTFPYRSSGRAPPESPDTAPRNPRRRSASARFSPGHPYRLHERCVPPAIRTLWNGGTDGWSSPSAPRSTTDCSSSEGRGRTEHPSCRSRRTESPMWDVRTSALPASRLRRRLPRQPREQSPPRDPSPSPAGSPE